MNNNGTFSIPPETTDTTNIAQVAAIVYQMLQDDEQPTRRKPKKKDTIKDFIKILENSKGKKRKKLLKKLFPLMKKSDLKKIKKKGEMSKSKRKNQPDLINGIIRDSASTALRIAEKYAVSQFPTVESNKDK